MYQKRVNELFGEDIFDIANNDDVCGKFHNRCSHGDTEYDQWLMNLDKEASITGILKSLSFNTAQELDIWNQPKEYLYMTRIDGSPSLSDHIIEKLIRNIPDEAFMSEIWDCIHDYYILLNDHGAPIPDDEYPSIYIAYVCMVLFTTTYFHEDLTNNELDELSAMCSGGDLIIDLPDEIKLVRLRGARDDPTKNRSVTYHFPRTDYGLVKLILAIAVNDPLKLQNMYETLANDSVIQTELTSMLHVI